MKKIVQFFKDSVAEMKKVVWPSREDVSANTRIVIVSVIIFAAILGVVDFLLLLGIDFVF